MSYLHMGDYRIRSAENKELNVIPSTFCSHCNGRVTSNVTCSLDGNASPASNTLTPEASGTESRLYDRMSIPGDHYDYLSPKSSSVPEERPRYNRYIRPCFDVDVETTLKPDRNDVIMKEEVRIPTRSTVRRRKTKFERHKRLVLCCSIFVGFVLGFTVCCVMWLTVDKLKSGRIVCELDEDNDDKGDVYSTPLIQASTTTVSVSSETTTSPIQSSPSSSKSTNYTVITHFSSMSSTETSLSATTGISSSTTSSLSAATTTTASTPTVSSTPNNRKLRDIHGGHVYVHWGRKDCGPGAELLYAGFAAGGHYQHPGGSTDTLCLPEVPVFSDHVTGNDEDRNLMYSVKYGSSSRAFQKMMGGSGSNLHNGDLPCSACQAAGRPSHVLVPGRSVCMHGWTLEYSGYLMGSAYAHTSGKELLCVDSDAEVYTGSGSSVGGSYLYFAEVRSGFGGYTSGNELPCVICTR